MTINPIPGVTQPGTLQWLNPNAFVSAVDPSTGQCSGGDNPQHCQFGNLGRNALRGPDFVWSDFYLTKWFPVDRACEAADSKPSSSMSSTIRISGFPAWYWPAFLESLRRRRVLERSPTPRLRRLACSVSVWVAIAAHA